MGHQACIEHPTWLAGPGPQARRGSPEGQRAALWRGLGRAAPGPAHQRQGVQYFNAWGKKLTGSVNQTKRTFTGQYLDDTGLLFYTARSYDPGIGRFVSAHSLGAGLSAHPIGLKLSYLQYPAGDCGPRWMLFSLVLPTKLVKQLERKVL